MFTVNAVEKVAVVCEAYHGALAIKLLVLHRGHTMAIPRNESGRATFEQNKFCSTGVGTESQLTSGAFFSLHASL